MEYHTIIRKEEVTATLGIKLSKSQCSRDGGR